MNNASIDLSNDNFNRFAISNYFTDKHINVEEFAKSLKIMTYINRLLKRDANVNHRLILNHIIITKNTFGTPATIKMLLFKISGDRHIKIMTYLLYLGYLNTKQVTVDIELFDLLNNL